MLPTLHLIDTIKLVHREHQGLSKAKALLRSKILFLEMDKEVKNLLNNCITGQLTTLIKDK